MLLVVVGKDGRTYDVHVRQSLGMGSDEKAIEAVSRLALPARHSERPASGNPKIAVQVDFRLY